MEVRAICKTTKQRKVQHGRGQIERHQDNRKCHAERCILEALLFDPFRVALPVLLMYFYLTPSALQFAFLVVFLFDPFRVALRVFLNSNPWISMELRPI